MFEKQSLATNAERSDPNRLVRCNICGAVMRTALFRCPACGEMTEGNEKEINGNLLAAQLRKKVARKKEQIANLGECRTCGKRVLNGNICNNCASRHFRNSVFLIACASAAVAFMLLYLLHTP